MADTKHDASTDAPIRDLDKAVYWLSQPAMIITAAAGGRRNLMFAVRGMHFLESPPSVTIGVDRHSVTVGLIEQSGEFGVNVVSGDQAPLLLKARELSRIPSDQADKFELFGVETFAGDVIGAPLIKGCVANFECKVLAKPDVGEKYYFMVGNILAVHGHPDRRPLVTWRSGAYVLGQQPIPGTQR